MTRLSLAVAMVVFSCSSAPEDDAPPVDAGEKDAGIADAGTADAGVADAGTEFALSSTVLTEGAVFPVRYTCADTMTMGRVAPPLAWTSNASAKSYAVVMTDTSIALIHWVAWDISASTTSLAEGVVPAGTKQTTSYDNVTVGYRGPCPPVSHGYRFVVTALDVEVLPGVTAASSRAQVQAAIAAHAVASASLSGTYGP
ncbi:MAG: YbhB/YbcL family Raf kinase inhibitor-like protein [Archangium sp.]|nr:YbhB/YbcL family Raf kinase inhibitor-like protein [Archangium sp.]